MSIQKLAGVQFKGFHEGLSWEKILMWPQVAVETNVKPVQWLWIRPFVHRSIRIRQRTCTDSRFFGLISAERKSCVREFDDFCDLDRFDRLYVARGRITLDIIQGLILLFAYIPAWCRVLRKAGIAPRLKREMLHELIELWYFQKQAEPVRYNHYRLFVAFYDARPQEAFMRELFRLHHVPTATLQHGQFIAWRENVLENSGIEFRCFQSDYFLAWNKMTIDEAIKQGVPAEKMELCGIISFINVNTDSWICPNNCQFGVVIGHPMYAKENLELIQAANLLAKERDLKFYLKLHPNYAENHFDDVVDTAYYLGNIPKGIPMANYANSVDFSLVGSSSVFAELVFLHHDVIRYSNYDIKDKFRDMKLGKIYHTVEEIIAVYDRHKGRYYAEELFDYVCSVKDVSAAYRNFLARFNA